MPCMPFSTTRRETSLPTVRELAESLDITKANAHEQISQLIRKGYVQREENCARCLNVLRYPEEIACPFCRFPLSACASRRQKRGHPDSPAE